MRQVRTQGRTGVGSSVSLSSARRGTLELEAIQGSIGPRNPAPRLLVEFRLAMVLLAVEAADWAAVMLS